MLHVKWRLILNLAVDSHRDLAKVNLVELLPDLLVEMASVDMERWRLGNRVMVDLVPRTSDQAFRGPAVD